MAEKKRPVNMGKNKLSMNYILEPDGYEEILANYLNSQPGKYPVTPEDIAEEMRYFAIYRGLIKSNDGEVVGLGDCYVSKAEDTVYGENLLIDPKYQGLVYGGSFMLTIFDKLKQIYYEKSGGSMAKMVSTLQSGNLRAGALYERIGYFALNKSGTLIQNFFSFVYTYPRARKFFEREGIELLNCWKYYKPMYDEMLNKMNIKTYPYVFGTKNGFIRIILDAITEYPMLVEDNDILTACWIEDQKAYIGLSKKVTWLVKNNGNEAIKVNLFAEGNGGLKIKKEEEFILQPGEGKMITEVVKVFCGDNPEDNFIKTEVKVGDEKIDLKTGYRLEEVIKYVFERDLSKPFRVNSKYHRSLKITNIYAKPIKIKGKVTPDENKLSLSGGEQVFEMEIPSGSSQEIYIDFKTHHGGIGQLKVSLNVELEDREKNQLVQLEKIIDMDINILDFDSVLAWKTENNGLLLMENENYVLVVPVTERNGSFYIYDKLLKEEIVHFPEEEIGPPFIPEFVHKTTPIFWIKSNTIRKEEGKLVLYTEMEHRYYKGIIIIRQIKMSSSNVFTIDYTLKNQSGSDFTTGILRKIHDVWRKGICTLPLTTGLIKQKANGVDFPGTSYKVEFKESWMALEWEGRVLGVVWNNDNTRISYRRTHCLPQIDLGTQTLKHGEEFIYPTIYLYYGYGNADTLRNLYNKVGYGENEDLIKREMLDLNLAHQELFINDLKTVFKINVDRAIEFIESRWIKGTFEVSGPDGWDIVIEGDELKIKLPQDVEPGWYRIKVIYKSKGLYKEWPVNVWVSYCKGEISVTDTTKEEQPVINIDNGQIKYQLAPQYDFRLISLAKNSVEYLCTNYPEAKAYHKESPWFGGIGCKLDLGKLINVKPYHASKLSENIILKGAGYRGQVAGLDDMEVKVEYLTVPGIPVLVVYAEVFNGVKRRINCSLTFDINLVNLQKAEMVSGYIFENDGLMKLNFYPEKEKLEKRYTSSWAAVETLEGEYLVLVHPGKNQEIVIENWGLYGVHLKLTQNLYLAQKKKESFLFYLILEKDIDKCMKYLHLKPLVFKGEN